MATRPMFSRTIALVGAAGIEYSPCTEPVRVSTPIGAREFVLVQATAIQERDGVQLADVALGFRIGTPRMIESVDLEQFTLAATVATWVACYDEARWRGAFARAQETITDLGLAGRLGLVKAFGKPEGVPATRRSRAAAPAQDDLFGGVFA